jgi:hypothetical protein
MPMFAFGRAILLMCMRVGYMMGNANIFEEGIQGLILSTPIGLHITDLSIKLSFN